jgi:molybdopterin synthase catalytic subunit
MKTSFILCKEALQAQSLFRSEKSGAEVYFEGIVRSPNKDKEVLFLEFEAYPELFENEMNRISQLLNKKYHLNGLVLHHRIGKVFPGECAVFAGVYSTHRSEAFLACEELMNHLKSTVPIWKKEYNSDGSHWVSSTP